MTTIHYREIISDEFNPADVIDEHYSFDLKHFADACGQSPEWVLQLLEYDILDTRPRRKNSSIFWSRCFACTSGLPFAARL